MKSLFLSQLKLLLWKNFRLRRRRPIALVFEILLPLLIIFILVAVRTLQLKSRMELCEFNEKQMASMGPIPFLRDFVCTFNTTCYNKTQIDWNYNTSYNILIFLNNISDVYNSLPNSNITINSLLIWALNYPDKVEQFRNSFNYFSKEFMPILVAISQIQSQNKTEQLAGMYTLEGAFCGSYQNDLNVFLSYFMRIMRSKRYIRSCEAEFASYFRSTSGGSHIYNIIGPFMFGKIYYTPNSDFTRELIKRANITFKILDSLRLSAVMWRLHFGNWVINEMINNQLINSIRNFCRNINITFCDIANQLTNMNNVRYVVNIINLVYPLIEDILNCAELNKFVPLKSPSDMDNFSSDSMSHIFAVVVLPSDFQYMTPQNATFMKYKIRMPSNRIDTTTKFKVLDVFWSPFPRRNILSDFKYYTSGFLLLQETLDQAFIEIISNNKSINVGSSMQIMPYPCYVNDKFVQFLANMMPFLMIIAWSSSISVLVKNIVYEKENRLKEFMRVMGLTNLVHWLSWFISTIVVLMLPIIAMSLILKYRQILQYSSPGVIFILILSFVISVICQCFMISVFFDKANVASVTGVIIYFILYLPFLVFVNLQDVITVEMYYGVGLLAQVTFSNAINFIAYWEQSTEGVQFSNLFESGIVNLNFGVGHAIIMLWVDTVIYIIIAWYVENVFPGEYGVGKRWYFLFTKKYWCPDLNKCRKTNVNPFLYNKRESCIYERGDQKGFENEPSDLKIGISIKNLVKIYPKASVPAVHNLSLNFYQSQITAFLGHNGAGKTTTISILTGIYSPTSGTALILDNDIRTDIDAIRSKIGLCPQHNILFGSLTVADHIYFYGLLKGMNNKEIKEILPKIVEDVGLTNKINTLSKNLSGGMKRKLSVAMAFIGDSRIVFLDEPTAGVDPFARRGIWDLLLKYRSEDRTIILTTHHMDEADYLSDRIAIISQGKLQCCGSSVFLKKIYGDGYYLILVKHESVQTEKFKENQMSESGTLLLQFIQNYIIDARMVEENRTQWTIVLPQNDINCKHFSAFFDDLDRHMNDLMIASYGLSDTSIEEVFLKVAEDPSGEIRKIKEKKITDEALDSLTDCGYLPRPVSRLSLRNRSGLLDTEELRSSSFKVTNTYILLTGIPLVFQQICGLLIKRFHHTKRNIKGFIAELLLPLVMVLIMIGMLNISSPLSDQPSMVISPWLMMPKSRLVNLNTFYRRENISDSLINLLEHGYRSNLGESGTRCMNPSVYQLPDYRCYPAFNDKSWSPIPSSPIPLLTPECDCNKTGYQECPNSLSGGPLPSNRLMPSSDILANVTGYNISDYLMKNFRKFVKKQYGGFQFLLPSKFGLSTNLIGRLPLWDGIRNLIINSSENEYELSGNMEFVNNLQTFFNLSGLKTNFTRIWTNSKGYVSMPAYSNIFSNLLLRSRINALNDVTKYGISVANHPLKYDEKDLLEQLNKQMFLEMSLAIFVIFGLSFIPASFVLFLIEERTTGSKRQQYVSGVSPYIYWLSNFFWDIIKFSIPVCLIIIIFWSFNYQSYIGHKNCGAFICLLFFYGLAIIPHMYPFSYIINTPSTAFVVLNAFNLLIGSITTIATFFLDLLQEDEVSLKPTNNILKKVFLLFPQYDLGRGMMDLSFNYMKYNISGGLVDYDPFDWEISGKKICSMLILFVMWWVVIFIIESGVIHRSLYGKFKNLGLKNREIVYDEDIDVAAERERITDSNNDKQNHTVGVNDDVLKVINLTKIYNASWNIPSKCCKKVIKNNLSDSEKRKLAVNNICFGVKEGECFGLLGVNGAGKTTTFKMLTGEEDITRGIALINGYSIITDMISAHKNMGFCPQFDALHSLLTCEEELYFYCRIRGIQRSLLKATVEESLNNLSLIPHTTKTAQTLSGGNKRKLSTAIALIGYPKIIFLDEPTSGMDAGARRYLWNVIQKITRENKISVILTSHNMEECEVLCHRLSIMVNGQMKCLGSVQHLKSKFGDDYFVKIRIDPDENSRKQLKIIMEKEFKSGVSLKDENFVTLQYQFDIFTSKLSMIFDFFQTLKSSGIIVDFSVSQTSLDEVFINFAKEGKVTKSLSLENLKEEPRGYVNESFERASLFSNVA